ncbi:hypothetical protein Asppvi_000718 [Aspergillus pseudoviridinutans]|uniref:Uncharacterized protein n=1 Tax=Aspergillus pseudoviridinutans TaxID=1517512 RepID=A0A9P3B194_9EURO|nr:uncharacterized protein Asppvi_000718 [Aspergillus pseudoviridinutans]GIJ82212.1 hypothetical protein Asppvi_000718 [Aspergillus pseudoviridinutans]
MYYSSRGIAGPYVTPAGGVAISATALLITGTTPVSSCCLRFKRKRPSCVNSHTGQCRPPATPANTTASQEGPAVVWNGGVHITVNAPTPRSSSADAGPPARQAHQARQQAASAEAP